MDTCTFEKKGCARLLQPNIETLTETYGGVGLRRRVKYLKRPEKELVVPLDSNPVSASALDTRWRTESRRRRPLDDRDANRG
jgi:hypothetical protein